MNARRLAWIIVALACAGGLGYVHHWATDFPTNDPIHRVDAALIAHLKANPGLHVALAEDAVFEVELDLRDDPTNQTLYSTSVDKREPVPRSSIHVQRKGEHGAIHADNWNPKWSFTNALAHGAIDLPVVPLIIGLAIALAGAWRARKPRS